MKRYLTIALFVLSFLVLFTSPVFAADKNCTSCTNCSSEIQGASAGSVITLNASVLATTSTCINFNGADNIIFDCNGFPIVSNSSSYQYGISLPSSSGGSNNNTVRNCNVSHFQNGLYVTGSSVNTIINNTAYNTSSSGFYSSGSNNTLINNTAYNNGGTGFSVSSSNNITLTNNVALNKADGFSIQPNNNNINLINNTAANCTQRGFLITNTNNNVTVINNTAMYCSDSCFLFQYVYNLTMTNNTIIVNDSSNQQGINIEDFVLAGFAHNITTSNTINGVPVLYQDGVYTPCTNNAVFTNPSYSFMGFVGCVNITVENATLDAFVFAYVNNSIVRNSNISNSYEPFKTYFSSHNTFSDNTVDNSGEWGMFNYQAYNNTFIRNTLRGNYYDGIVIYGDSSYNTIINNTIYDTGYDAIYVHESFENTIIDNLLYNNGNNGIYIWAADNNSYINNTIINNSGNGVTIDSSSFQGIYRSENNTFTGNILNNNGYGIVVRYGSNDTKIVNNVINNSDVCVYIYGSNFTTITNSTIKNCTTGIQIYDSRHGLFYNNIINNTVNLYSDKSTNLNYWNTTLDCNQTNIMGRACIGGNFWTNPSGNGFSDVCNDTNENYICDETYTPLTNNTDYLALWRCKESWTCGEWSQCVAGAQNRTCTDRRSCGTTYSRPSLTQSCVMPGGPGGSSSSTTTVTEEKKTWSVIKPDEGAKMTIDKKEIGFTEITIAVNNQVSSTTIQVSKVESKPAEVSKPSENVYQYVQIKKNIEDEQIKESKIKFKVEKKWLSDNNINKLTVKLNRYNNGWNNLTTKMLSDDDNYVYYESESPGFSLFAITGDIVVCDIGEKRCLGNEIQICDGSGWNTTESCTNGCDAQTITCITPAQSCTSGEIRCNDKRIEVCENGQWKTQSICESGCAGESCAKPHEGKNDFLIYAAIFLIAAVLVFVYVKMTAKKMEKEMFIKPKRK